MQVKKEAEYDCRNCDSNGPMLFPCTLQAFPEDDVNQDYDKGDYQVVCGFQVCQNGLEK